MSDPGRTKVIIIGAGIGGLTAAIALRRAGCDVTVFEKRTDPSMIESGGGMIMWNNAMRAFAKLELADEIAGVGTVIERSEWRTPKGRLLAAWPVAEISRKVGAPAVGVRRMKLQGVLTRAAGPEILRLGVECTGYTHDDSGVTVETAGGEERADVLIGADGINSMVRSRYLGGWTKPRYAGYALWFGITSVDNDVARDRLFREMDGPGARVFMFPVGDGETYWSAVANAPEGATSETALEESSADKELLLERYHGWAEPIESLIGSTDGSAIYRREITDRNPIKSWGDGRFTLLGDAAHPLTPNLGQGAAQAIEDAVVLADALRNAGDIPTALRAYEAKRVPRTTSVVKRARMIGNLGRWDNPLACAVRDVISRLTIPTVALKQHRKDMSHEL